MSTMECAVAVRRSGRRVPTPLLIGATHTFTYASAASAVNNVTTCPATPSRASRPDTGYALRTPTGR